MNVLIPFLERAENNFVNALILFIRVRNKTIPRVMGEKVMVKLAILLCTLLFSAECYAFNCTITTTSINFGSYDVFSSQVLDSNGTITVDCNNPEKKPIPINISISSGNSGKFNPRQMQGSNGTDRLNYYIFTDPSGSAVWGDGTGGSSIMSSIVTKNSTLISTVYARIPAGQNVYVGTYTDLLTATVIW